MGTMVSRLGQFVSSLFFKILASFWVVLLLTVATTVILVKISSTVDHPLPIWAKHELERSAFMLKFGPPEAFPFLHNSNQLLFPQPPTPDFILVNSRGQIVESTPLENNRRAIMQFILSNSDLQQPSLRIISRQHVVFGPQPVRIHGQNFLLYIHHPVGSSRLDELTRFQVSPEFLLIMLIIFSLVACMALAWHIAGPLKTLRNAANQIASGDLSVKLPNINRHDEVGQLADSLSQMSLTLGHAITNQQRLLSDISHELRSPLTRLNMAVALSNKRHGETRELQRIEREAQRLEEMIRALLGLSRMQLDEKELQRCDVSELLAELNSDCQFEATQLNKHFELHHQNPKTICCFPGMLLSGIENLCRNAIKYAQSTIELSIKQIQQEIYIEVQDDGPGIGEQELEHIFRPFYRASEARDRDSGGVGLGLAIADWAVRQHGGRIEAKNRTDCSGLIVSIILPLRHINDF